MINSYESACVKENNVHHPLHSFFIPVECCLPGKPLEPYVEGLASLDSSCPDSSCGLDFL